MQNDFNSWAAAYLTLATTYLVHSTLLLGGTWLLLRFGRVQSWTLRERLWKLAAVLPFFTASISIPPSISPPILRVTLNGSFSPLIPSEPETAVAIDPTATIAPVSSDAPVAAIEEFGLTQSPTQGIADGEVVGLELSAATLPIMTSPLRVRPSEPQPGWIPTPFVLPGLCCGILALAISGLVRVVWQSIAFRRILCGSQPISCGPTVDLLHSILRRAQIRRPIRLLSSKRFTQPAAFGLYRWTIVLPEELIDSLQPDELRALLAHEAAHLTRGDVIWLSIGRFLCWCFAFQPLNFVAREGWRRAAEFLCDQWAVRHSGNRFALARCLTHVAEWTGDFPPQSATLLAVGSRSSLSDRVELLVNGATWTDSWNTRRRRRLMSAAALTVAINFACFAPRTRLLAETPPEVDRPLSTIDKPGELGSDRTLAESIASLGQEVQHLAVEMQRVDNLVAQNVPQDSALRAIARRLTVQTATLLERQQHLAALSKQLHTKEGIRK